jgi:recombination protein RecA
MNAAAQLRSRIETALADRVPGALTLAQRGVREVIVSGWDEIDAILRGGIPCGAVTELIGPACSGRTSMALAYMAAVTQSESVGAWIDVADALDPESAAANGVDLEHLLWVRCGAGQQRSSPMIAEPLQAASSPLAMSVTAPRHTGGGSPHPRSEGRDMPQAIGAMLHAHGGLYDHQHRRERRMIGTPGAPNRPLTPQAQRGAENREEQVNSDRLPARRGENLNIAAIAPRCAEPQPRRVAQVNANATCVAHKREVAVPESRLQKSGKPWQALDQALRATDLLLQSGGFRMMVLDLGSTAPEFAWRIPLATWFRFRAACERTRTSLVLLTQHPCARSSAGGGAQPGVGCPRGAYPQVAAG